MNVIDLIEINIFMFYFVLNIIDVFGMFVNVGIYIYLS